MRAGLACLIAILLAVGVPLAAQQPAAVDRLEELMWQGALQANTAAAYDVYLRRYPQGAFATLARENATKLGGTPAAPVAAPAAMAAPPAPARVAPAPFLCRPAVASATLESAPAAELGVYLKATRVNSLDLYRRYVEQFPAGLFAAEVRALIGARTARADAFASAPVPGPSPARAHDPLTPAADDYPPAAARAGEQGIASAVWEVAEDGCVQACRIDRASGSAALDAATCRLITTRGRYDPARDAAGKPMRVVASASMTWQLPK